MRGHIDQKIVVGVVFVSAMFMSILDATIVNVALPTIGRDFHVPATAVDGVSIAFLVSLAVFIPASGWLGDRLGAKKVLLTAIVVFTAASMLCGIAQTLGELVFFRILQGAGGGMLAPVGMAMLYRAYPPEERIRASSILMTPTTVAPALGPILGGVLVIKGAVIEVGDGLDFVITAEEVLIRTEGFGVGRDLGTALSYLDESIKPPRHLPKQRDGLQGAARRPATRRRGPLGAERLELCRHVLVGQHGADFAPDLDIGMDEHFFRCARNRWRSRHCPNCTAKTNELFDVDLTRQVASQKPVLGAALSG